MTPREERTSGQGISAILTPGQSGKPSSGHASSGQMKRLGIFCDCQKDHNCTMPTKVKGLIHV